jgi:chromosome segregation ATPase
MASFSPFDNLGHVRDDLASEAAAIEALPDTQREKLFGLIATDSTAREGETRLSDARKSVNELSAAHDAALAENNRLNKPITHQEALLATIKANRPGYKPTVKGQAAVDAAVKAIATVERRLRSADDKNKPAVEAELATARKKLVLAEAPAKAASALHSAVEAVTIARAELYKAQAEMKKLELARGTAVLAWMNAQTDRPSPLEVARASAKAFSDAARAKAKIEPADGKPRVWPLQKVLSERGNKKARTYMGPR